MRNRIIKIGVLLLFSSLIGGFVLYKMDFFNKNKQEFEEGNFEFPSVPYDEDVSSSNMIHSTKSLGGNSGIRLEDIINRDDSLRDSIKKSMQILMFSSKSAIVFDPEKDVDIILEKLKEENSKIKKSKDSSIKVQMSSSKYIKISKD